MYIRQFVVLLMTLVMLGKNVVCKQNLLTFNNAVEIWQNTSCIFPDKSAYQTEVPHTVPKLEQCRLLDSRNINADPDGLLKFNLCQAFYVTTTVICQDEKFQSFIQICLNPDLLQQKKLFVDKDVCTYVFESEQAVSDRYFSFFQGGGCKRICGVNSMRDVCELYTFIIYQFQHQKTCSATEKQAHPEGDKSELADNSLQGGNKETSLVQKPTPTPSTSSQTENTSVAQFIGLVSTNQPLEESKQPAIVNTNGILKTVGKSTTSTSTVEDLDNISTSDKHLKPLESVSNLKLSGPNGDESKVTEPSKNKLESPTSLLISKITSATTEERESTEMTPTKEEEEGTTVVNQSTSLQKVADDDDDGEFIDNNEDIEGSQDVDDDDDDKSKIKSQDDNKDVSKGKFPERLETGKKKQQQITVEKSNPALDVYDDTESSPGSGHFLAYFLTAVVICISGYVIYHNKQKILAFIIEGRNSGRGGRQRSKDVKYTQLKSSVEEVMPSLEQTATGKNFVY